MALNPGVNVLSNGKMTYAAIGVDTPGGGFNGGTPMTATGRLAVTGALAAAWVNGLPYDAAGRLCIAIGVTPPASYAPGGIPMNAAGNVQCDGSGVPVAWLPGGIPLTANGGISVTGPLA